MRMNDDNDKNNVRKDDSNEGKNVSILQLRQKYCVNDKLSIYGAFLYYKQKYI